jgi:hypothetical protein
MLARWTVVLVAVSAMFVLPALAAEPPAEEPLTTTTASDPIEGEREPFSDLPASLVPTEPSAEPDENQ